MPYCVSGPSSDPKYNPLFESINEDGSKFRYPSRYGLDHGYRLTEATDPSIGSVYRFARLTSTYKGLPEVFLVGGDICVDELTRGILESLEPDLHQFFPVVLFRTRKQTFDGTYYLLNIGQLLDSLVLEKSNLKIARTSVGDEFITTGSSGVHFRTLRAAAIEGKHLWREKIYPRDFYLSDHLFDMLKAQKSKGIYGLRFLKVQTE